MMLDTYEFKSCFAPYIDGLLKEKHSSGFIYDSAKYTLIEFDRFCMDNGWETPAITRELMSAWGTQKETESRTTQGGRISVVRQLSIHMRSLGIECYIPAKFSTSHKALAYVLDTSEISDFFKELDRYKQYGRVTDDPRWSRLAMEYRVIFRLIFCCGLRVSEARKLKVSDIDFSSGRFILKASKGHKDRIVFMTEDMTRLCNDYRLALREKFHIESQYMFPSSDPEKPFQNATLNLKFKSIWGKTSHAKKDCRQPTVHSLRHSFVVMRMNLWMDQDVDLNAMMPYLSKFLGHSSVEDTFYYYHQVGSAFKIVREKDAISDTIIPEVEHE